MRILFLTHSFNSLSQRLFVELRELGHEVSIEFDINDSVTQEAVDLYRPDLILAPYLKRAIPQAIWQRHTCLIVHPGIKGDRGPASLDWAIYKGESAWGVTVLQANAVMDGGPIWAAETFPMRAASKASLYRHEVTEAAVRAVLVAVERFESGDFVPEPLDYTRGDVRGDWQPAMPAEQRHIDWEVDTTDTILRKIRAADGMPGAQAMLCGRLLSLYDAHRGHVVDAVPGTLVGHNSPAVCIATRDASLWIGHLRDSHGRHPFKLPAVQVLADVLPSVARSGPMHSVYREIDYQEAEGVGYLSFEFYNGAMSTRQCRDLLAAYQEACARDTRVLVLAGGADFWSNGMHLNVIEAADSAADASWENINALDDLAECMINTTTKLTVSALRGNAGAGGVFLARAADQVWARRGVILNPHYKDMGNLYGSEYWTYLLPLHAGEEAARRIMQARLPMGVGEAHELGLVDRILDVDRRTSLEQMKTLARELARADDYQQQLARKQAQRASEDARNALILYREAELERMRMNFYGFDPSYHVARYNFVYKRPKSRTPVTLAAHRRTSVQVASGLRSAL